MKKAGRFIEYFPAKNTPPLDSWHANITRIQRRQCVIFTHDQIRFTIVQGVTQKELIQKACGSIGELNFGEL
ncbi:MAG: hypothetical protein V7707_19270 [Motiliproteus sp.]